MNITHSEDIPTTWLIVYALLPVYFLVGFTLFCCIGVYLERCIYKYCHHESLLQQNLDSDVELYV